MADNFEDRLKQIGPFVFEGEPGTELDEQNASTEAADRGAALWLEEQRALGCRAALEGAQELFGWLNECFVGESLNAFDRLTSDGHHPDEINRRIDAVAAALKDDAPAARPIYLTLPELALLREALETYTYWEIGDTHTRNDGYFREDWCDPKEDAEALEEYAKVTDLEAKLIAAEKAGGAS